MLNIHTAKNPTQKWQEFLSGFVYPGIAQAIVENREWDDINECFKHPPMDPRATYYAT